MNLKPYVHLCNRRNYFSGYFWCFGFMPGACSIPRFANLFIVILTGVPFLVGFLPTPSIHIPLRHVLDQGPMISIPCK